MSVFNPSPKQAWKTYQVILDQNPPVFNTLHEVFSASGGVKLVQLEVYQTNTPTDAEEIDIVVTLDGTSYTYDSSAIDMLNNAGYYCVYMPLIDAASIPAYSIRVADMIALGYAMKFLQSYGAAGTGKPIERHSIKVEVRQTSPIEAAARIRVKATYEVLEAV